MGWIADLLSEIPSAARYKIQLEQLETENVVLKEQVNTLKSGLGKATEEITRLNLLLQGAEQKNQKKYDEVTQNVIKLFFNAGRELPVNYIASALAIEINTALYHFDILLKDNLIIQTMAGSESSLDRDQRPRYV